LEENKVYRKEKQTVKFMVGIFPVEMKILRRRGL
jgi:hypothetical protein